MGTGFFSGGGFFARKTFLLLFWTFHAMPNVLTLFFLLKIGRNIFFILCIAAMGNKLYEIFFFFMCQKLKFMKQVQLFKKGFVIFLKGATFSDFIETRL